MAMLVILKYAAGAYSEGGGWYSVEAALAGLALRPNRRLPRTCSISSTTSWHSARSRNSTNSNKVEGPGDGALFLRADVARGEHE
jgi:hypothetical protein